MVKAKQKAKRKGRPRRLVKSRGLRVGPRSLEKIDAVSDEIAVIAKVSPEKMEEFRGLVFVAIEHAERLVEIEQFEFTPRDSKSLKDIAKATGVLAMALKNRTSRADSELFFAWTGFRRAGSIPRKIDHYKYPPFIDEVITFDETAAAAVQNNRPIPRSNKRGRRAGVISNLPAYRLLEGLLDAVAKVGGKKLGLNHADDRGGLIDAFKHCATVLHEGFKMPSSSWLRDMRRRIRAQSTKLETDI